jgi:hypothetical protein
MGRPQSFELSLPGKVNSLFETWGRERTFGDGGSLTKGRPIMAKREHDKAAEHHENAAKSTAPLPSITAKAIAQRRWSMLRVRSSSTHKRPINIAKMLTRRASNKNELEGR